MTAGLWPDIRAALNGEFWVPAGTLITANGTMVPNGDGPGFPADLARGLMWRDDGLWLWKWVNYPAATFPMRPSIDICKQGTRDHIRATPGIVILSGYSQSAIAMAEVWRDDILSPAGELHDRLDDVMAVILWGDPLRTPGYAFGNHLAGQPVPPKLDGYTTGGIAGPNCLRPEHLIHPTTHQRVVLSFANPGDLYASAPVGDEPWVKETEVGHDETLIFDAVMKFDGTDLMAFVTELSEIILMPLTQLIPLVQAIWNGLVFLTAGMNAPHWTYNVDAAVNYMIDLGTRLQAQR